MDDVKATLYGGTALFCLGAWIIQVRALLGSSPRARNAVLFFALSWAIASDAVQCWKAMAGR